MQFEAETLMEQEELAREAALALRVDAFGASLARKRDEYVAARKNSGIEDEWRAAEDAYQGVDDANRGHTRMAKPVSPDGGATASPARRAGTRSTVVLNITRPYVDAASARVADMLLPTDESPWALSPSPAPAMAQQVPQAPVQFPTSEIRYRPPQQVPQAPVQMPMPAPAMPADPAQANPALSAELGQPAMPQPPAPTPEQQAAQAMSGAAAACELATTQISDWLVECQWHGEVRKLIEDCARLGSGVLKGPSPHMVKMRAMVPDETGAMALNVQEAIKPHSRCISPWNFFPDPACGENIHDGSGCWEVDTLSAKALRELKKTPGYLADQIDKALEEGPKNASSAEVYDLGAKRGTSDRDVFQVWYYHGVAEREDLEAAMVQDLPDEDDVTAYCVVTMVNGRVIKAALNPLDSGALPYDMIAWQRKEGLPYGTGVSMQINVPQRMLTSATRNMLDNAGLSSGPQIAIRRGAITPADGNWELTPRKMWWVREDADVQQASQAFFAFNIPTMQQELQNIVQFAMKMAEDVTGLPAMMQGQGTNSPDTVGGMQMLQNNAGTVLRRLARLFDVRITEPHIRRYYEWMMLYGENDAAKGDFQVDARGSSALVEREVQMQSIMQMGQLVTNPAYGIDPAKWFAEMLKSQRLDPEKFLLSDEQRQQMAQQQPPPPPQIAVAQIRAEADAAKAEADRQLKAQMHAQTMQASVQKMTIDQDRDNVYVQSQANRDQAAHQARMAEMELRRELAMLDYSKQHGVTLEKIKADLAKKAMEINATRELAGMRAPADMLPKPPIEPPGIAPSGESFQR